MKQYTQFSDLQADLQSGATTVTAVVENYLKTIEAKKQLNAFVEVFAEEALERAQLIQQKINNGTAGKLAGMVIGVKDNIVLKNHEVTASSKILKTYVSPFTATAAQRLENEDAIFIGRLSCDEFAMGSSNEHSVYGPVKNPVDETRVPGGSSGGSAAAVAANLCFATLGSDTGGSIRQPASFCGVVGVKPTYGRISRYGLIAYASSFDQIGPITHTVKDAALLLEIMAGKDALDNTSSSQPVESYSTNLGGSKTSYKLAYYKGIFDGPGINPSVKESFQAHIDQLRADGHTVEEVEFPYLDSLIPTYYVLTTAEASSNLSRFDGIRYGYRSANATDIETTFLKSRSEGFGKEVKRRIMMGTFVLSAGFYDAYYAKAQKVRRLVKEYTEEILSNYDFIINPTTPHGAFQFGAKTNDPIAMYLEDIFTVQANIVGMPAISIPLAKDSNNMPVGIQYMSNLFEESKLLNFTANFA